MEEERRLLGIETEKEEVEHGRPIDPGEVPVFPLVGPLSRSVLIGNNPDPALGSSRINTDLPGGLNEAAALFERLTKGQPLATEIDDKGNFRTFTTDQKTQMRVKSSGDVRIDRPIDIDGKDRETIHFKGQ